jgi:hypothetical protein
MTEPGRESTPQPSLRGGSRLPIVAAHASSLRGLGYDERWLQDWLAADPSRLGLGDVSVIDQEQGQAAGGLLDLLALDHGNDTYYSIEVQLGEIDASHGFRVFDYWARNRARLPGKTHVAVLMAENAGGRFRLALDALAETVPLIVIELRCWQGTGEALLIPEIVVANDSLDLADTPAAASAEERTEEDWRSAASETMWAFKDAFVAWARDNLGEPRVDYRPQSYIGVRYGRRVWAPLWPRKDGAYVYLPDPDGSRDQPSLAFESFEARLQAEGLTASWTPKYNAGANPIGLRLVDDDLRRPVVQELLRASHAALGDGAEPWSERVDETARETGAAGGGALVPDTVSDQGSHVPASG